MDLPDKATKHIERHRKPVGTVKEGKIKVKDGDTGRVTWRQGTTGMLRDWDGDPIATAYNRAEAKKTPKHNPRETGKRKARKEKKEHKID